MKLNDLYIKGTGFYDKNDLVGIYSICNGLDIDYEVDEEDNQLINTKISTLKQRIGFMESTFTWKWHLSKDDSEKNNIILAYIRMQTSLNYPNHQVCNLVSFFTVLIDN